MRAPRLLALATALLAAVAMILVFVDRDDDIAPFFVGMTVAAGIQWWAVGASFSGPRRRLAWTIVALWLLAAIWISVLLVMYQAMCACSLPPPSAEVTYLGLTATVYHLAGLYGGLLLAIVAAVLAELHRPQAARADGAA